MVNSKPQARRSNSILDLIAPQNRKAADKAVAQLTAARTKAQLEQILGAPSIANARKDGGLEGFALELVERFAKIWQHTTKAQADAEKLTRIKLAEKTLVNELFDESVAKAKADGKSEAEALASATTYLEKLEGVMGAVRGHFRAALDYVWAQDHPKTSEEPSSAEATEAVATA